MYGVPLIKLTFCDGHPQPLKRALELYHLTPLSFHETIPLKPAISQSWLRLIYTSLYMMKEKNSLIYFLKLFFEV